MKKGIMAATAIIAVTLLAVAYASPVLEYSHKPKIKGENGQSVNWAGYAVDTAQAGAVTDVKGSWTVPKVLNCPKGKSQYSSFWTGIDGDTSNTVEQIGTDSDCRNGKPNYYSWYEFYPNPGYYTPVSVQPGDNISAEVSYNSATQLFTVSITNQRTGQQFSTSSSVSGAQRNSAEWIAEAPSNMGGILPLANFGTAYFGSDYTNFASTNYGTISGTTGSINSLGTVGTINPITMYSIYSTAVKAQPSNLSTDGTSFSVQWKSTGP